MEEAVFKTRGAILREERELKSGVHEVLNLTVTIPFLWGVPGELGRLRCVLWERMDRS